MKKQKLSGMAIVLSFVSGALALAFAAGDLRHVLLGKMDLNRWIPFLPTIVFLFFMYVIRVVDKASARL